MGEYWTSHLTTLLITNLICGRHLCCSCHPPHEGVPSNCFILLIAARFSSSPHSVTHHPPFLPLPSLLISSLATIYILVRTSVTVRPSVCIFLPSSLPSFHLPLPLLLPLPSPQIKTSIRVGVVGLPNVGKSSLINSLKRARVAAVGAVPGLTRCVQEVALDRSIRLLDSPGVVFAQVAGDPAAAALRNAIKPEDLDDPVLPGRWRAGLGWAGQGRAGQGLSMTGCHSCVALSFGRRFLCWLVSSCVVH